MVGILHAIGGHINCKCFMLMIQKYGSIDFLTFPNYTLL